MTGLAPVRTRLTKRAWIQGVLGLVLYGAGANVSAGWVVALAALTLGSIPWAWWTARRTVRTLEVARTLPATVTAGRPTTVRLELRARTSAMAVVEDDLTATAGVATGLATGASLTATTVLARGHAVTGEVRVHASDPFGLVTVEAAGPVPSATEVLPAVPAVRGGRPHTAWALEAGDGGHRAGAGVDLVGVREYRAGDPPRAVAWRASARREQLVVRELVDDALARVRVEVAPATWEPGALDRALEVACAVAEDATRHGHPTEVAVDGTVAPWSPGVRRLLATVPPHAGEGARPLRPCEPPAAEVVVTLRPVAGGVAVDRTVAGDPCPLGVVPADADLATVEAWLTRQLGSGR